MDENEVKSVGSFSDVGEEDEAVLLHHDDAIGYEPYVGAQPESPEMLATIRKWLNPTEYDALSGEYRRHLKSRAEGTATWLCKTEQYIRWHDSSNEALLWIKGIPGSGKSVYAAALAHQLSLEGAPVLFFFFRQIIEANHRPVNLLRDWICQMLHHSPVLQGLLKEHVEEGRNLESLSTDDLWRILRLAMKYVPRVYCVVDALDEMDSDCLDFVQSLISLGHWRPSAVKVLLTSRPVAALELVMRHSQAVEAYLDTKLVDVDIATYVRGRLAGSSLQATDQATICQAVPGRANGLFLYARLALDAFLEPGAQVAHVLTRLPADLNALYANLIREHSQRSGVSEEVQLVILRWVTHATRPLRLLELADMLRSLLASRQSFDWKDNKRLVRNACGPLLSVLPDETISVVHHTFTEFLTGRTRAKDRGDFPILEMQESHQTLTQLCLTYIEAEYCGWEPHITSEHMSTYEQKTNRRLSRPFLEYASSAWWQHARHTSSRGQVAPGLLQQVRRIFHDARVRAVWMRQNLTTFESVTFSFKNYQAPELHLAAFCGLLDWVDACMSPPNPGSVNLRDSAGRSALWWAADNGQYETVDFLLRVDGDEKANADSRSDAMHQAAKKNHHLVVKRLLDAGTEALLPDLADCFLDTCRNNHVETIDVLLPLVDYELKQKGLLSAARRQAASVISRLTQEPNVNPDMVTEHETPLAVATRYGHREGMRVLLDAGADAGRLIYKVDTRPRRSYEIKDFLSMTIHTTPLHELFRTHSAKRWPDKSKEEPLREMIHLLINGGAKIDQKVGGTDTALHLAQTHLMVRLLLEAGATPHMARFLRKLSDPGSKYDDSRKALQLLLRAGADINERNSDGSTALMCSQKEDVILLLEHGASCSPTDHLGRTVLHRLGAVIDVKVLRALLAAGADPNAQDNKGNTLLHLLLRDSNTSQTVDAVVCLLKEGADPNARNNKEGRPACFDVFSRRNMSQTTIELSKQLAKASADFTAVDGLGRTILYTAITNHSLRMHRDRAWPAVFNVDSMSRHRDFEGNTMIHHFAANRARLSWEPGQVASMFNQLSEYGIDVDAKNNRGRTALHLECWKASSNKLDGLQWLLQQSRAINDPDYRSFRPVHFAAVTDEYMVETLIDHGVDITATTADGHNVLHLGLKARKWDVVGIVLAHISGWNHHERAVFLNQADKTDLTPLHFACRLGRPELVESLLLAGSDPLIRHNQMQLASQNILRSPWTPPFFQCVLGEMDRIAGNRVVKVPKALRQKEDAGAYMPEPERSDRTMLPISIRSATIKPDQPRYEEIFQMLIERGFDPLKEYEAAYLQLVEQCAQYSADYLADALLRLYDTLRSKRSEVFQSAPALDLAAKVSQARWFAEKDALLSGIPDLVDFETMNHLLQWRRYDIIRELYKRGMDFTRPIERGESILHLLVRHNLWDLLDACCTPEEARVFDDYNTRMLIEIEQSLVPGTVSPLLMTACEQIRPNLQTIKVLVEKKGVDINTQAWAVGPLARGFARGDKIGRSALHGLVRDGGRWWLTQEVLVYLADKGMNLDVCDVTGTTPLHNAFSRQGTFAVRIVRSLLSLGADMSIPSRTGANCLTLAEGRIDLLRELISAGAVADRSALVRTISSADQAAVELLLTLYHQDSTSHWRGVPRPGSNIYDIPNTEPIAGHPLTEAANLIHSKPGTRTRYTPSSTVVNILELLFSQGGNVSDTYFDTKPTSTKSPIVKYEPLHFTVREAWKEDLPPNGSIEEVTDLETSQEMPSIRVTVLHEILYKDALCEAIFDKGGDFDPNLRDHLGRTPLLAYCRGKSEKSEGSHNDQPDRLWPIRRLLDRGADILAVDHAGRNILHILLGNPGWTSDMVALLELLKDYILVLSQQLDLFGYRPLHYFMIHTIRNDSSTILRYLIANGVPADCRDEWGNNAIHYALYWTRNEVENLPCVFEYIRVLVDCGLSLQDRNLVGETPLHRLFRCDSVTGPLSDQSMQFLESLDVDWTVKSNDGSTLLHTMVKRAKPEVFKQVMDQGVDVLAEDVEGRTSLDIAAAYNNKAVLAMFEKIE